MDKQVEASNLDTSVEFAKLLREKGVHKQILTNMKKKEISHPTVIQKTLFDMFGKKQNFVIDAPGSSGKTSGCLLFALCTVLQKKAAMSIAIIVPNHKFIANAFTRLLEIVQHTSVRLINLDSEKEIEKGIDPESVNVYIGSYNSFFKCFQEEKVPVEDFSSFIFDDVEYSISLGNTPKLLQLCKYLQNKIPEDKRSFFLVSGNTELDDFKELKESFGVKFTNIKLVSEVEEPIDKDAEATEDQQRADIMRTMIKQFYFIGAENHLYCALYVVSKFDVMKGSVLLVAEDVDMAYKLKVFLDRAHSGEAQVYNTEGVTNIRAYNVALFNGGSIRYLIVPKEFLKDYKKNKNIIQRLKNVRNLVFFNCEVNYDEYNGFLNLFKGALNLNSTKNIDIGYKVLYLAMNSVDEELKPKDSLLNLMSHQKNKFGQVLYEPLAVPRPDIEGFSYSVGAVLDTVTKKTVKVFKLIELKRNILKNVNMKVDSSDDRNTSKPTRQKRTL